MSVKLTTPLHREKLLFPASILVEAIELTLESTLRSSNNKFYFEMHPAMQHLYRVLNEAIWDFRTNNCIPIPIFDADEESGRLHLTVLPCSDFERDPIFSDEPILLKQSFDNYYDRYGWIVMERDLAMPVISSEASSRPARTSFFALSSFPKQHPAIWNDLLRARKYFDLSAIHQTIKKLCLNFGNYQNNAARGFEFEDKEWWELNLLHERKKICLYFDIDIHPECSIMRIDGQKVLEIADGASRPDCRMFDLSKDFAWLDLLNTLKDLPDRQIRSCINRSQE